MEFNYLINECLKCVSVIGDISICKVFFFFFLGETSICKLYVVKVVISLLSSKNCTTSSIVLTHIQRNIFLRDNYNVLLTS